MHRVNEDDKRDERGGERRGGEERGRGEGEDMFMSLVVVFFYVVSNLVTERYEPIVPHL